MALLDKNTILSTYARQKLGRFDSNNIVHWEVVVAQLVERSLSIPEVCSSTPIIGKILLNICLLSCLLATVLKRQKKIK